MKVTDTQKAVVSASAPSDPGPATYAEPPFHLRELFLDHVRRTGRPEDFPGLATDRPELEQEHAIVTTFDVDPRIRSQGAAGTHDYAACCLCGPFPKYLSGCLIWSADGHLRLIGHICGRDEKHFGRARYDDMTRIYARRIRVEDATLQLKELFPQLPGFIGRLETLRDPYHTIAAAMREMRRHAGDARRYMKKMADDHNGELVVERADGPALAGGPAGIRSSTGGASTQRTYMVSALRGAAFLSLGFEPDMDLSRIIASLEAALPASFAELAAIGSDEEFGQRMNAHVEAMDEDARIRVATELRDQIQRQQRLGDRVADAAAFLTAENAANIRRWLDDPNCHVRLELRIEATGMRLRETGSVDVCRLPFLGAPHRVHFGAAASKEDVDAA